MIFVAVFTILSYYYLDNTITQLLFLSKTKTMFNLYQSINKKDEIDKEPQVIGHERFYQGHTSRSGLSKKRRTSRRAHSVSEFNTSTLTAANKRAAFSNRSQSTENKTTTINGNKTAAITLKPESLAKALFSRRRYLDLALIS